jgi:cytochrome c-type biogenesis protein CcmH/NrfF
MRTAGFGFRIRGFRGRPVVVPCCSFFAPSRCAGHAQEQVTRSEDAAERAIGQVRSPYCPGLMLEVCPSPEAGALRDSIRDLAREGMGEQELMEWMIDRHGEEWRAVPKRSGPRHLRLAHPAGSSCCSAPAWWRGYGGGARRWRVPPEPAVAGEISRGGARRLDEALRSGRRRRRRYDAARASVALALSPGAWVIHPLVQRRLAMLGDPIPGGILDAEARKRVALASLREVEYDRIGGKLDDQDYQRLRAQLEREAVEAIEAARGRARGEARWRKPWSPTPAGSRTRRGAASAPGAAARWAAPPRLARRWTGERGRGRGSPLLEARAVEKWYGPHQAVRPLDFSSRRGVPDALRPERRREDDAAADAGRGAPPLPRRDPHRRANARPRGSTAGAAGSACSRTRPSCTAG